ncbi:MAG: PAS domain S-box protein [Chitinispirillaceae bacterium]|nr:PAS domain S-box protein [Chitinispirillaceae bacterium]
MGTLSGVVYTLDEKGIFTSISDVAESAFGFTRRDLIGRHFSAIIHPADIHSISREYILPRFAGVPTGNERAPKLFDERRSWPRKTTDLPVRICPKPGFKENTDRLLKCKVNASGEYGRSRFLGTVGVMYEITEEENTSFSFDIHRQYNAFELLVQALSHVFSNVFTGIYGNLQLIEMQMQQPELFRGNIEAIENSIDNAVTLIRKLSKTVSASETWNGACFRKLLLTTADEFLRGANVEYHCTVGPELWRTESDPDYIRHIFRAVYFHIVRSVVPEGPVTVIAANVYESPLRLPRIDCAYIMVGFDFLTNSEMNQADRINEVSSLERIASMALSYELLKKIGGHLSVCTDDRKMTVELYLPALRTG